MPRSPGAARQLLKNSRGEAVEVPAFTATEAKNAFGSLMAAAVAHGTVAVVKHDSPRAVLLSIEEYENLVAQIPDPLAALSAEFDALVEKMQTAGASAGVDALFGATSRDLGKAAVKAARKARRRA